MLTSSKARATLGPWTLLFFCWNEDFVGTAAMETSMPHMDIIGLTATIKLDARHKTDEPSAPACRSQSFFSSLISCSTAVGADRFRGA